MKPTLILDCSITISWCFSDEARPEAAEVQGRLVAEAAVVPSHWFLEVTNVLAIAEKRKRISVADSTHFLKLLSALDIQVDDETSRRAFDHLLPLCRHQGLTSYDAAYLDLALRRKLPLATLDEDLRQAATGLGVDVLGK